MNWIIDFKLICWVAISYKHNSWYSQKQFLSAVTVPKSHCGQGHGYDHSSDLLTTCGVAHLVVHGTSGSTSYETIPRVRLETSRDVLLTVDRVVQRRDDPRWPHELDDDDDDMIATLASSTAYCTTATAYITILWPTYAVWHCNFTHPSIVAKTENGSDHVTRQCAVWKSVTLSWQSQRTVFVIYAVISVLCAFIDISTTDTCT